MKFVRNSDILNKVNSAGVSAEPTNEEAVAPVIEEVKPSEVAVVTDAPVTTDTVAAPEVTPAEEPKASISDRFAIPEFESKILNKVEEAPVTPAAEEVEELPVVNETSTTITVKLPDGRQVELDKAVLLNTQTTVREVVEEPVAEGSSAEVEENATEPATTLDTVDVGGVSVMESEDLADAIPEEAIEEETEESTEPIEADTTDENHTEEKEFELSGETWDKFVDNVIIPTLTTCMEKTIDYIKVVLAKDLKDVNPEGK